MPAPGRTQALLRGVGTWPAPAGVGGSEKPPTGAGQRPHYPQGPPDVLNAFKTVLDQAPGQPHCPSPAHADQLRTGRCQGTTDFLRLDKGLLKTPLAPAISFQTPPGAKGKKLAMSGQAGAWEVCNSRRSPMACPWLRRRLRTPHHHLYRHHLHRLHHHHHYHHHHHLYSTLQFLLPLSVRLYKVF